MDPQQAPQINSTEMPPYSAPQPAATPPKNQKKTWLIIGIIIVVVLVIAALLANQIGKNSGGNSSNDSALYYDRPGHNPNDYKPKVGDPQALTMKNYEAVASAAGKPILFACNTLPFDQLQNVGVTPAAGSAPTTVQQTLVDGVGKASVEVEEYTLPIEGDDSNDCSYVLEGNGRISLQVYQPAYVMPSLLDSEIQRVFTPSSDIEGLKTYKYTKSSGDAERYMIRSGDEAVEVYMNLGDQSAKSSAILQAVAKNFASLQSNPKGPAIAKYDSPTFKKSVAVACDYLSDSDMKSVTGNSASVFGHHGYATGTGVTQVNGRKLYNFVQTNCERKNTGLGSGLTAGPFDQTMDVTVWSFQDQEGAKGVYSGIVKEQKESAPMTAGDEATCYRDTAGQNTVIMRKGRFLVEIVLNRTTQENNGLDDIAAMTQKLTPYARQTADKLASQQ